MAKTVKKGSKKKDHMMPGMPKKMSKGMKKMK